MAKVNTDPEMEDYRAKDDADVLAKAAAIQADPERHAKAKVHLDSAAEAHNDAAMTASETEQRHNEDEAPERKMKRKVKQGLKKAFPKD